MLPEAVQPARRSLPSSQPFGEWFGWIYCLLLAFKGLRWATGWHLDGVAARVFAFVALAALAVSGVGWLVLRPLEIRRAGNVKAWIEPWLKAFAVIALIVAAYGLAFGWG
jgi:hypothetical protein